MDESGLGGSIRVSLGTSLGGSRAVWGDARSLGDMRVRGTSAEDPMTEARHRQSETQAQYGCMSEYGKFVEVCMFLAEYLRLLNRVVRFMDVDWSGCSGMDVAAKVARGKYVHGQVLG